MLKKAITNAILETIFGRKSALGYTVGGNTTMTKIINGSSGMWLGLSTTTPTLGESGITGFTEPTDSEYKRVPVGGGDLGSGLWCMDAAQGGIIKNGKQILFPAAKKEADGGTGYGTITHFGIFESATGGSPIYAGHLSEVKKRCHCRNQHYGSGRRGTCILQEHPDPRAGRDRAGHYKRRLKGGLTAPQGLSRKPHSIVPETVPCGLMVSNNQITTVGLSSCASCKTG